VLTKTLTLGYSPCPNDTFIFYALVHSKIDTGNLAFRELLLDVETLNQKAVNSELDITKVSFHAFGNLKDNYCLLRSGGALGKGCGPLIVVREALSIDELKGKKIAIPGSLTTAFLLLKLYLASPLTPHSLPSFIVMSFDKIIEAVRTREVDAGLIIHESRFTYQDSGLIKIIDLGEWWEKETGLPIPLGCILAKRELGKELILKIDSLIKRSIEYAISNRKEPESYIKMHSQELADNVIKQHINLYVNSYSIDIGDEGIHAVEELFGRAEEKGIIPKSSKPLFM
jgi:1,4-dihydroxy-6-naphthoate synthase